ncbi:MAG TPA: hypothetical protein VFJ97_15540 [Dermatophilaceae bacterium]|nr:hypothetical protein [Dermatophilaceae bacterium]
MALLFLAAGAWVMWRDRVDRDGQGFLAFGTEELRTSRHAIVGDLQGVGPSWFYGLAVLGETRIRATSPGQEPLFIGIARKDDVFGYLRGVGYATIDSFAVRDDTTHRGGPPSAAPSRESIWAASTQGSGQQTLLWTPRSGDWTVVFMNADGSAGVEVRGDASAELPLLPWLAGGFVLIGGATGVVGVWVLVRALRRGTTHPKSEAR